MRRIPVILFILIICFVEPIFISSQYNIVYAEQAYKWDNPKLYDGSLYGEVVTVEFVVVSSYNSGKACFLNAHSNWKKYFTIVIFKSDFHKFNAPEDTYYMKKIRVTGVLKEYNGKPEIIVKSPSQIEIIK